jgi:hypothetical protein
MTLVLLANTIGSDREFILRRRSFVNNMNNRGPRIDPWGIPYFIVPQSEKKNLVKFGDFTSTFCLILVKYDLTHTSDTPQIP